MSRLYLEGQEGLRQARAPPSLASSPVSRGGGWGEKASLTGWGKSFTTRTWAGTRCGAKPEQSSLPSRCLQVRPGSTPASPYLEQDHGGSFHTEGLCLLPVSVQGNYTQVADVFSDDFMSKACLDRKVSIL